MISVPWHERVIYLRYDIALSCDDIRFAYEGTDIISRLRSKHIMRQGRISYRVSDISLKYTTNCNIIMAKEGAFMSENKLLDLSFEFAVAIVNLVDDILCKVLSAKKRKFKIKYI